MRLFSLALCAVFCVTSNATEPIRILSWNIQSGGSDTSVIIEQMKTQMPKYDIVALSEVPPADIEPIAKALGWKHFGGTRGGERRLMFAWSDRFAALQSSELQSVGGTDFPGGINVVPLFVSLKELNSEKSFFVVDNHFTRGNESTRNKQAELLRDWVSGSSHPHVAPTIAVGDYNMDYDFHTKKGNAAFDIIRKDGHWTWIEPKELIDTNWADTDGDGKDNFPDSMLDFVFVNKAAQAWKVSCEVVVRKGDFPDDEKTSDHRPVLITIEP